MGGDFSSTATTEKSLATSLRFADAPKRRSAPSKKPASRASACFGRKDKCQCCSRAPAHARRSRSSRRALPRGAGPWPVVEGRVTRLSNEIAIPLTLRRSRESPQPCVASFFSATRRKSRKEPPPKRGSAGRCRQCGAHTRRDR